MPPIVTTIIFRVFLTPPCNRLAMLRLVGSNISALIKALLLQNPHTVLEIRAPAGGFIAAFAAAISPIGKTAGAIVFC
jgi:hypothetical protein